MKFRQVFGVAALAACLGAGSAQAMDTFLVGPRAMGMAGANVASVDGNAAQYYNPAAFGFFARTAADGAKSAVDANNLARKDWGVDLYAGAGYRLNNDLGEYLDTVADIDLDYLSSASSYSQSDLADLVDLVASLNGLDEPGNAITANINAGFSVRVKHFGVGLRSYTEATGRVVEIDNVNLGLTGFATLDDAITSAGPPPSDFVAGSYSFFDAATVSALLGAGLTAQNIDLIQYYALKGGVDPALAAEIAQTLLNMDSASGGGSFDLASNTTAILLSGYNVTELPFTYGRALNDHVSVGGNLKVMKGRVYGTEVVVFDDGSDEVLENFDENYNDSTTFGLDLGVMARYGKFSFGLVGRNLNSPEFDGFNYSYTTAAGTTRNVKVPGIKLKPQMAAGVAYMPFETLTIEADVDLTKNETALDGYDTQNVAAGLEWDAFRFLALRAGVMQNLAEDDIDTIVTAGLGFNFWLTRLDLAAAASLGDTAELDGEDVPKYAQVSAQLSVDF